MVIMPDWKKDLHPFLPFPTQLSVRLQKGTSPFLSIRRNTIWIGKHQVWLGPDGTNTPLLRWYRNSSTDFGISPAANLAHWSSDLMPGNMINSLKCFHFFSLDPSLVIMHSNSALVAQQYPVTVPVSSHCSCSAHALSKEA